MPTVDAAELLSFCKATAESLRLDILRVLSVESFGVMELCHIFDTAQPGMSHHLKVLSNAGLVQTRREGNSIFYRRAIISTDSPIHHLIETLFDSVDRMPIPAGIQKRCQQIHRERARSSRRFFRKHADRLKENQDLIVEFSHYATTVTDLLSNERMTGKGTVIEVGPGESDLLIWLAQAFSSILAVDNSQAMLARTRQVALANGLDNVAFFHGELADLDTDCNAELIVLNMVLHHMPSPSGIFRSARKLLGPGGHLLIADLCPHDQDWTRDICGDLWLGFEPGDLDLWAADADLEKGQGAYLGLRNGFQVQVRLYEKTQ